MKKIAIPGVLVFCLASILVAGQNKVASPKVETKETKIARALSAAPTNIAKAAKVVDKDQNGKEITLREGSNGFTCFVGEVGAVGGQPFCANSPALQWENDLAQHKPKPTNAEPGIEYMLAGGTDWSATDPAATTGTPIHEPPHWMIMWPFDPAATGLPTAPKQNGSWIMWAGTPWSHLMINQRP